MSILTNCSSHIAQADDHVRKEQAALKDVSSTRRGQWCDMRYLTASNLLCATTTSSLHSEGGHTLLWLRRPVTLFGLLMSGVFKALVTISVTPVLFAQSVRLDTGLLPYPTGIHFSATFNSTSDLAINSHQTLCGIWMGHTSLEDTSSTTYPQSWHQYSAFLLYLIRPTIAQY